MNPVNYSISFDFDFCAKGVDDSIRLLTPLYALRSDTIESEPGGVHYLGGALIHAAHEVIRESIKEHGALVDKEFKRRAKWGKEFTPLVISDVFLVINEKSSRIMSLTGVKDSNYFSICETLLNQFKTRFTNEVFNRVAPYDGILVGYHN